MSAALHPSDDFECEVLELLRCFSSFLRHPPVLLPFIVWVNPDIRCYLSALLTNYAGGAIYRCATCRSTLRNSSSVTKPVPRYSASAPYAPGVSGGIPVRKKPLSDRRKRPNPGFMDPLVGSSIGTLPAFKLASLKTTNIATQFCRLRANASAVEHF
jgi:hypothetical protein